jgi:hypothetical protein
MKTFAKSVFVSQNFQKTRLAYSHQSALSVADGPFLPSSKFKNNFKLTKNSQNTQCSIFRFILGTYSQTARQHNIEVSFSSLRLLSFIHFSPFLILNNTLANAQIYEVFGTGVKESAEEGNSTKRLGDLYSLKRHLIFVLF